MISGYAGRRGGPSDLPVPTSFALCSQMSDPLCQTWGSNLGPQAYATSALQTELSPDPSSMVLIPSCAHVYPGSFQRSRDGSYSLITMSSVCLLVAANRWWCLFTQRRHRVTPPRRFTQNAVKRVRKMKAPRRRHSLKAIITNYLEHVQSPNAPSLLTNPQRRGTSSLLLRLQGWKFS